jgi:hypothetical protein
MRILRRRGEHHRSDTSAAKAAGLVELVVYLRTDAAMERDRIEHAGEHEGSVSVGLEERPCHPEAESKGRFSTGIEQTGATHETTHEGSFSVGLEERPTNPRPSGRVASAKGSKRGPTCLPTLGRETHLRADYGSTRPRLIA